MDQNRPPEERRKSARFSIAQKLIVGYAAIAFFTLAALAISLLGLVSLNRTARDIGRTDVAAVSTLAKLRAAILAQEGYAGRYAIFQGREFVSLFRERQKESLELLRLLRDSGLPQEAGLLEANYRAYGKAAESVFSGKGEVTSLRGRALHLIDMVDSLARERQNRLQAKLAAADEERRRTIRWTVIVSLSGFLLAVIVAVYSTLRISGAVIKLQRATRRIAKGDFEYDPQIRMGDEIGDLAFDFLRMAQRLKELERINLDASPLTRLPGNAAIERELEERIKSGESFAFCYADLDNFKAFSDRYGYSKGSDMIRAAGDLIYRETKNRLGDAGFVGHIGGDDFVMVLPGDAAVPVCESVIAALDAEVRGHYSEEDLAAGGIAGVDRYGVERFFPLVSVSIAVVVCGAGAFSSAVELARVTADLKDSVKEKPGSGYSVKRYPEEP